MIQFFYVSSWTLETIVNKRTEVIKSFAPIYKEDGVKDSFKATTI
ncbi:hypothetical protein [Clostridium sp. DJ247]|nr:hypothetical protein [Clostridium sp. DJ247]